MYYCIKEEPDEMSKSELASKRLWLFIALSYALSWLLWIPTAISGADITTTTWLIPYLLGGFGPSIAGIIIVYQSRDAGLRQDFWERVVDFKRISAGWYLFIVLVFPILFATTVGLTWLFDKSMPGFEALGQMVANPLSLIGMMAIGILAGPLAEELGWRGVALDRLQARWSPFVSSLILALFWGAWHLPLFFIHGTTQCDYGLGTLSFWLYMIATVPLSILFTWVYNHNDRSILAAVLLHFLYNFTVGLVYPFSVTLHLFQVLLLCVTVAGLLLTIRLLSQRSSEQTGCRARVTGTKLTSQLSLKRSSTNSSKQFRKRRLS